MGFNVEFLSKYVNVTNSINTAESEITKIYPC